MGLLDQVLGQVIGGMAGGLGGGPAGGLGGGRSGQSRPMPGGLPGQAGGGLGDLLGGAAGKYSPLVMALLALLASKHLGTGAGGYGSILNDVFGKITGGGAAPAGTGRYGQQEDDGSSGGRPYGGSDISGEEEPRFPTGGRGRQAGGGGFLESIGSMLDGSGGARHVSGQEAGSGSPIGRGLEGLSDHFRQNGHGETIESWIGGGQNQPIAPHELDRALGPDTVEQLSRQTGLGRDDLLSQLSRALPQVVDGLTPHGRLPSPEEHRGWI